MSEALSMDELLSRYAQPGRVDWIGLRTERRGTVDVVDAADITENGLEGDHRAKPGKRAVTLIQAEHLPVIAALANRSEADPRALRRNIVVSRINLLALRNHEFQIGTAVLRGTDYCVPCSHMETVLGHGGYNAMRGHGGITAEVVEPGRVVIGDTIFRT